VSGGIFSALDAMMGRPITLNSIGRFHRVHQSLTYMRYESENLDDQDNVKKYRNSGAEIYSSSFLFFIKKVHHRMGDCW
jgi:hypothetical protein